MKISLSHVNKYYQDGDKSTRGLEDISLTFETDSSFVVITGESGAGKSTLFRVLTGTEDFDEGEITFDNRPLSGVSDEERAKLYRENIAFDFQEYNLIEGFSPIENIVLSLTKAGYGLDEARKKASAVLDQVGLTKQKNMRVSKLSGGERQRVAIARCLASDAKVLLFDEPTGNLDPDTSKEIIELIASLQKNRLILYITHDFDLVRDKATRHIVLADGRVVSDEVLKVKEPVEEKEEVTKKKPAKVKSTLYTSFLFSFKRPARTVITILILLFCSSYLYFGAVGVASIYDMGLNVFNNTEIIQVGHGFGNEVTVSKNQETDFTPEESDDVLYDNLDLGMNFKSYLMLGDDLDTALTDAAKKDDNLYSYGSAVELSYSTFAPENIKRTLYEAKEPLADASPITVYFNEDYLSTSSLYSALEYGGFETQTMHMIPDLLFDNYRQNGSVTSDGTSIENDSQKYLKTKMEGVDKIVYIDKIQTFDAGQNSIDCVFSFNSDAERKDYLSVFDTSISAFFGFTGNFGYQNDSAMGKVYNPSVSFHDGSKYFRFDMTLPYSLNGKYDQSHIYLSNQFKDNLSSLYFTYNGAPLSLENIAEDDIVYFNAAAVDNPYIYYYSPKVLFTLAKEQKAYGRYYTRDTATADSLLTKLEENKTLNVQKVDKQHQETIYSSSNSVVLDLSSRIANLFSILAIVAGFLLVLLLARLLLSRFYYRKDSDEKVLKDIGYTEKDLYLNNALQFVFLMILSIVVTHVIYTLFIPQFITYYVSHPLLFAASILLSLAVSFFVSLPTRRQHKRKERHHD